MVTTIVIGNGVGMAIDPDYFKLEAGLAYVTGKLTEEQRDIIGIDQGKIPASEKELEVHHKILSACLELMQHEDFLNCLNDTGRKFPETYQDFIYQVARYFYDFDFGNNHKNYDNFIEKLIQYINKIDRCHIATLNYDKLLYKSLIGKNILKGYDGKLVDGMYTSTTGFKPENLNRLYNDFGWYMHLHGSPAFYTKKDGTISKSSLDQLPSFFSCNDVKHNHIVLAKTEIKPYIIANSKLLDCYFRFFSYALAESENLILFGYSGDDDHINAEIKSILSNQNEFNIKVVEWKGNHKKDERENFWKKQLLPENCCYNKKILLNLLDDIFDYDFN